MYTRRRHRRVRTAMSGVSSQPAGARISMHALSGLPEYTGGVGAQILVRDPPPPPPPPKPPPRTLRAARARLSVARSAMSGVSSQPPGARIYFSLGDDITKPTVADPATDPVTLAVIAERTAEILRRQAEEDKRRKLAMIVTAIGAVFAAARLGIIAIPHIRRRIRSEDD